MEKGLGVCHVSFGRDWAWNRVEAARLATGCGIDPSAEATRLASDCVCHLGVDATMLASDSRSPSHYSSLGVGSKKLDNWD
ncbi:uncharacterized [Tachysurus ichikawai]